MFLRSFSQQMLSCQTIFLSTRTSSGSQQGTRRPEPVWEEVFGEAFKEVFFNIVVNPNNEQIDSRVNLKTTDTLQKISFLVGSICFIHMLLRKDCHVLSECKTLLLSFMILEKKEDILFT